MGNVGRFPWGKAEGTWL